MTAIATKTVDQNGRLTLGKKYASALVIVREVEEGVLQVIRAEAVPAREAWLYKNPEAIQMVLEGLEQAKEGKLGPGPDLNAGTKLTKAIGD